MYQGGSDDFPGPLRRRAFASTDWGIDFRIRSGGDHRDVATGQPHPTALDAVRLLLLANDWSLRNLIPAELAKGFGFLQSKPATAFSPVAVTPTNWVRPGKAAACTRSCAASGTAAPSGRPRPGRR
jgi:fumarylacetoacetate (FAA) hydrolase